MEKLKQAIEKKKNKLYNHMESDEYVNPDMLDNAIDVIQAQNAYIDELEKELAKR